MSDGPPGFERIAADTVFSGRIFRVVRARFRHADGEEVERENVVHGGAVGIVVHDDEHLYLVRQPREAIMRDDVLEIPAGRLDVEGEPPEEAARRELAEELGLEAEHWSHLKTYYSSAGFTNEELHLYVATGLRQVQKPEVEEDERIELVRWPLADLDGAIDACLDAKTLIGLLLLRRARG
jgi:8-oxo-dGTP pyrophosphatase MutT (NUDIX family)